MPIKHNFVSSVPDDSTNPGDIKPQRDWNSIHKIFDVNGNDITSDLDTMLSKYISGALKGLRGSEVIIAPESSPYANLVDYTTTGINDDQVFNEALESIEYKGHIRAMNGIYNLNNPITLDYSDSDSETNCGIDFGESVINNNGNAEAFILKNKTSPYPNEALKNFMLNGNNLLPGRNGIKILDCTTAPAIRNFEIWNMDKGINIDLSNRLVSNCYCEGLTIEHGTIGDCNIGINFNDAAAGISPPISYDSPRIYDVNFVLQQENSIGVYFGKNAQFYRGYYEMIQWLEASYTIGLDIMGDFRHNLMHLTCELDTTTPPSTGQIGIRVDDGAIGANNQLLYDWEASGTDPTQLRINSWQDIGLYEVAQIPRDFLRNPGLITPSFINFTTPPANPSNMFDESRTTFAGVGLANLPAWGSVDIVFDLWNPSKNVIASSMIAAWGNTGSTYGYWLCSDGGGLNTPTDYLTGLQNGFACYSHSLNSEPTGINVAHTPPQFLRGRYAVLRLMVSAATTLNVKIYDVNIHEMTRPDNE